MLRNTTKNLQQATEKNISLLTAQLKQNDTRETDIQCGFWKKTFDRLLAGGACVDAVDADRNLLGF